MVGHGKKLLVLDVNGLLLDTYFQGESRPDRPHDAKVNRFYVYKRPSCDDFIQFCFQNFVVGVWSSAREHNVHSLVDYIFKGDRGKLAFVWHQQHCTDTGFRHPDNKHKPVFLKELSRLWNKFELDLPWIEGEYGPSNTLLIDDSAYKAINNPGHTAIFPKTYRATDSQDVFLGDKLQPYLECLVLSPNVQKYLERHPIGEPCITIEDPKWTQLFNPGKGKNDKDLLVQFQGEGILVPVSLPNPPLAAYGTVQSISGPSKQMQRECRQGTHSDLGTHKHELQERPSDHRKRSRDYRESHVGQDWFFQHGKKSSRKVSYTFQDPSARNVDGSFRVIDDQNEGRRVDSSSSRDWGFHPRRDQTRRGQQDETRASKCDVKHMGSQIKVDKINYATFKNVMTNLEGRHGTPHNMASSRNYGRKEEGCNSAVGVGGNRDLERTSDRVRKSERSSGFLVHHPKASLRERDRRSEVCNWAVGTKECRDLEEKSKRVLKNKMGRSSASHSPRNMASSGKHERKVEGHNIQEGRGRLLHSRREGSTHTHSPRNAATPRKSDQKGGVSSRAGRNGEGNVEWNLDSVHQSRWESSADSHSLHNMASTKKRARKGEVHLAVGTQEGGHMERNSERIRPIKRERSSDSYGLHNMASSQKNDKYQEEFWKKIDLERCPTRIRQRERSLDSHSSKRKYRERKKSQRFNRSNIHDHRLHGT